MDIAEDWLRSEGYKPTNTAATKPYDFKATKGTETLFVEVKGTTSDSAEAVLMTHGEVALHRKHKGRTALMIVAGIRLQKDNEKLEAFGGVLEALIGWDIDEWLLKPTMFRISRGSAL